VHSLLGEALRFKKSHPDLPVEIVVVDDGSTDQTARHLEDFAEQVHVIRHTENKGYGAALKTGLFYSRGENVAFMDFDGTCSVHESRHLLETLRTKNADMVMGFRLHEDSKMPSTRRLGNSVYRLLLKALYFDRETLPRDVCTGFRVLKKGVAEDLFDDLPDDLSFSPALTAKALKKRYVLVDHKISYNERAGRSKISLIKDGLKFGGVMIQRRLF